MLDVLASKQVDIYISLATSLVGAVFGLLLDRCIKGSGSPTLDTQSSAPVAVSMSQAVHVSVAAKANADDQLLMFFTGVILVALGIVYMFFREELLYAGLLLVLFFVGTWAGVVVHSLYRGFFHGWMWFGYLLIMLGFGVAAMRVVGLAKAPMFAPRNFMYLRQIVNERGLAGLRQYFTAMDFRWFGFHLLGVILFFAACWRATFSMLHYAIISNRLVGGASGARDQPWLVRATARYGSPWRNVLVLVVFMVVANYFVSGQFFMWFEHEFPGQLNHLIQIILHGRRGN